MTDLSNSQQNQPKNKLKICRICATECENGQKLFNSNNEIQRIAVQICSFISIKLVNIQIYPNYICPGCQLQFEATYEFFEIIRNGPNKLAEKFGYPSKPPRKPKQKRVHMVTVDENQFVDRNSDKVTVESKRIPKVPRKFIDSMQGHELENLYNQIGVTKHLRHNTKQLKTENTETIAHIEDQDGVTLGEMLSVAQESQRNKTRYQCDFCKKNFARELAFYNHLSMHTNILYECTECQTVFKARKLFDDHVRETNHSGLGIIETPRLENSPEDDNQNENIVTDALQETEQSQPKESSQLKKFVCIKCSKSFNTNLAMQRHQKTHSESRPFQCDICSARFKRKFVLEVHKTSHTKEQFFKCYKCSKKFSHYRSLQLHLQGIHEGLKPYSCSICKKSFTQKSNLRIHKRVHTGDRPFVCLKCGAAFKTSSQCRLHQKTHTTTITTEEKEEEGSSLIVKKQSVAPEKTFECKICGKLFAQRSNMRKHIRIHTGEKPYACHLCPQKFSDSSNFQKHKRNHPKEKTSRKSTTTGPYSLLKSNLPSNEVSLNLNPNSNEDNDGVVAAVVITPAVTPAATTSDPFTILEDITLPNVNDSLMAMINADVDERNSNPWSSDVIVTDIPNDETSIVQQQQHQEMLMNQVVCISHQDPMNPVGRSLTTFFVVN